MYIVCIVLHHPFIYNFSWVNEVVQDQNTYFLYISIFILDLK